MRTRRQSVFPTYGRLLALLATILLLWSHELEAQGRFPLAPADTSSPRSTLEGFLDASQKGIAALRRGAPSGETIGHFSRADSNLDLSEIPAAELRTSGTEAGLLLYEVLSRTKLPSTEEVPAYSATDPKAPSVWVVPNTEIKIVRIDDGDRKGQYLFSADTVRNIARYYEKVRELPVQEGFPPGTYEVYIDLPNLTVPHLWVQNLPDWTLTRLARNPLWKWGAIVLLAVGVVLLMRVCLSTIRRENNAARKLVASSAAILGALVAEYVLTSIVGVRFETRIALSFLLRFLAVAFALMGVFFLFELFATWITRASDRGSNVSPQFVRLLSQVLAILVVAIVSVEAAEYFGLNIAPLIAGLGIGGLAVALAARPTLENVIGGFILFADRPARIGDFCKFGEQEGFIEEIGLRSTRIRRRDDRLVTIPNATFSQFEIVNYDRVRERLYDTTLQFRYETTPDQLRFLLAELRKLLIAHPMISDENLHVRFLGFGAYSLDVQLFAYVRTRNWLTCKEICEDVNLRIMDIVAASGTGFAFPSQTAYLARDNGIDEELKRSAEHEVALWRSSGSLPFPEFGAKEQARIVDTLGYPPEGSSKLQD